MNEALVLKKVADAIRESAEEIRDLAAPLKVGHASLIEGSFERAQTYDFVANHMSLLAHKISPI